MKKFKAAVIGCGNIGSGFDEKIPTTQAFSHAGAYTLSKYTDLVAASDPDERKMKVFGKKWGMQAIYADYIEMLNNESVDIVSVATPAETHHKIIRDICTYPIKAIYCEKPISNSIEDAEKIIKLCAKNKIQLTVNHQRRFGLFYQELERKLSAQTLGSIQHVNCNYTRGIFNTGTHLIDLFLYIFGDIESVDAEFSRAKSPFKTDPNLDATLRFKSGFALTMKACDDLSYLVLDVDILTTKARICLSKTIHCQQAIPAKNKLKRKELMPPRRPLFKYSYPKYGMVPLNHGVDHIAKSLRLNKESASSGKTALQTLKTIQAMLDSANQKKTK